MTPRAEFIAGDLAAAVGLAASVVPQFTTIPVLQCVKIEADRAAGAIVTGTDLDMEIAAPCPASINDRGFRVCVSARQLRGILRHVPPDTVCAIEVARPSEKDYGGPFLVFKGARYRLICAEPADFPLMAFDKKSATVRHVDAEAFVENLRAVERCISREETRYYISGVCLYGVFDERVAEHRIRIVATDGHRLAVADFGAATPADEKPIGDGKGFHLRPILTRDFVLRLISGKGMRPEALRFDQSVMAVRAECAGGVTATAKLIDGTFPDIERVIPKPDLSAHRFEIDAAALRAALRRIKAAFTGTGTRSYSVQFNFTPRGLYLSAESGELSGTGERVDCEKQTKGEFAIGFNAAYILDLIENIRRREKGPLVFVCGDPATPALVPGERVSAVIMPLRVTSDAAASQTLAKALELEGAA